MPPAPVKCCHLHWNVGSDDFVIPAVQAIAVALFNISLLLSCLVALFASDLSCNVSPLLYAPLMAIAFIQVVFVLNEGLVLVLSSRGSIWENTRPRRHITKLIYVRAFIAVFELVSLVVATVGTWLPATVRELQPCPGTLVALHFARAIIFFLWIVYFCFLFKVLIYTDPLGCFSPGLLEHIPLLDEKPSCEPGEEADGEVLTARQYSYWVTGRERLFHQLSRTTSAGNVLQQRETVNEGEVSYTKMKRRLGALFCCLCVRDEGSVGGALEEVARGFYTIFGDYDNSPVLTDIIAGLRMVHYDQKRTRNINDKFRKSTFRMMPSSQRYSLHPEIIRSNTSFDWSNENNQLLFDDLVHYMHYAMGVYGWTLHVFDNLCCGLCQLSSLTCCRCNYLCFSKRRDSYVQEGCCMCHVGSLRIQTGLRERDIIYLCCENQVNVTPFCVCRDHRVKSVVVCVRGTLSFKDSLTDMSYSPVLVEVAGVRDTYVHGGMLKAALAIFRVLKENQLLQNAFEDHEGYQLVITGHSLGAGVASILALLIKINEKFPNMTCYAFSPPGSLFSFPLAQYCRTFITSVVLGNDLVPRVSLRSLLYLKFSVVAQLDNCTLPKYKVLFMKRALRRYHDSKENDVEKGDAPSCLEDQVCNDSTTQNWLRDKIFNTSNSINKKRKLSKADKLHLQKSLSIHPAGTSIVHSGLFDLAISLHPRDSILSASLFEPGPPSLPTHSIPEIVVPEVATPGTTLHQAVSEIRQHCKAHDGETFLPLFPPGRLLHIQRVQQTTKTSCWSSGGSTHELTLTEVCNENIGVILIDRGMADDHLPNRVLAALKICKENLLVKHPNFDYEKIKTMREQNEQLYRKIYRATMKGNERQGEFTFLVNETPMVDENRPLSSHRQTLPDALPATIEAEVHEDGQGCHDDHSHLKLPSLHLHVSADNLLSQQRPHLLNLFVPKETQSSLNVTTTHIPGHSETLL